MATKLIVNSTNQETRVAVMENDRLSELYIERGTERGIVGNIYKGKVVRVLPGMQAAFVDIGLERAAFLYVTDFFEEYRDAAFAKKEPEKEKEKEKKGSRRRSPKTNKIQDLLTEGQDVLVQVAKDPIGTKGARLTSHISLPGRHLVFMPTVVHVGVSKKIETEGERKRLREIIKTHHDGEGGFIVRTAAVGQSEEKLAADIRYLTRLWKKVLGRNNGMKSPSIIHQDLSLLQRTARDFFTDDISKMIVDNRTSYREINQFLGQFVEKSKRNVEFYKDKMPIFERFKVEEQIQKALERRVWLKSGGYLVFDQTEALTSIDVNTGRFVGSKNLEETIFKTNMEAVDEIVNQLRLRNIGGLIILDLIDMDRRASRDKVYRALEDAIENDKARTNVLKISELGLVEMTRKRTRENLVQRLCEPCEHCNARGFHKAPRTIAYEIIRKLKEELLVKKSHKNVEIAAHPKVNELLKSEEMDTLIDLENRTGRRIVVRENSSELPEVFEIKRTGFEYVPPAKKKARAAAGGRNQPEEDE